MTYQTLMKVFINAFSTSKPMMDVPKAFKKTTEKALCTLDEINRYWENPRG